jgi:hypothetical protein
MSRGLGALQREIKDFIRLCWKHGDGPVTFSDIRLATEPTPTPSDVRSMKRALKNLVDREEVFIVGGLGGPLDPYHYMAFEDLMASNRVKDVFRIRGIAAGMREMSVYNSIYGRRS